MELKKIILLIIFITISLTSFSQISQTEKNEIYPDKYTFEKADEFLKKNEFDKAIWFYINLFPENKNQVIEIVKTFAAKNDTIEISKFIKNTFALYGINDPSIISFKNGTPNMNLETLKIKGAWGDELIQKVSGIESPLNSASEYNFRGIDKAKANDFKGAIKDFDNAIEIEPTGQIYFNRAYSKSMIEDFNGAIEDYNKTIELNYRLAEAYFERGYCKDQINNIDESIKDYTLAIETDKNYANAYNNRACIRLKQKDFKTAIEDFDKAIKINSKFIGAYVNRGAAKKALGDDSGACKDWKKAVNLGYEQANEFLYEYCK